MKQQLALNFSPASTQPIQAFMTPSAEVRISAASHEVRQAVRAVMSEQFGCEAGVDHIQFPLEQMDAVRQALNTCLQQNNFADHKVEKGFGNSRMLFVQTDDDDSYDAVDPGYGWKRR